MKRIVLGVLVAVLMPWASAQEISWPQEVVAGNGALVLVYQPQIEEFTGNLIAGRSAVSVKADGGQAAPVFGAIWIEAKIDTNRETRTAVLRDLEVTDVRFADSSEESQEVLATLIEDSVEGTNFSFSVDQLLADLDASVAGQNERELKHEPPVITLSTEPALLVPIDGEPVFQEIEGSQYERVVNTPFLIVKDGRTQYLYVGSNAWFKGKDPLGPWSYAEKVPDDVAGMVEPVEDDGLDLSETKIIVSTVPTELIVADGEPSWAPVEGMNLLYMDNTDSDVFLELSTQSYYILLSGRWYRGTGVEGDFEWQHVPNDQLPEPFSDIPEESVNGAVLSQVAGTQQARDAVLDSTIPQTAAINRDDTSFSVSYDGDPDFAPIEDIEIEYAQNTAEAVFKYGNRYYACKDGVWYTALDPEGPWGVAAEVPDAIYQIPPSNPHHNVTYVYVYDVTPEVVYVGYTPGYYGSYYYSGVVVYGTGWYYRPWYGPYYYPRYPTWGFHVRYNPWTGWNFGISWTNGPFRFTIGTGGWWGVGGYRPRPRPYVHGGYRKTNVNINIDNSINIGGGNRPGNGNRPGAGNRPEARPSVYDRPENRARNAERPATADTRQARPAQGIENNVLADRSGNVYQRDRDGSWNQRTNTGEWQKPSNMDRASTVQQPSARPSQPSSSQRADYNRPSQQPSYNRSHSGATRPQLERDYSSRQHGAQRTQSFNRQMQPGRRR